MSSQDAHRGPLKKEVCDAIAALALEAAEEMDAVDSALEELIESSRRDEGR